METGLLAVFWLATGLLCYCYIAYPVALLTMVGAPPKPTGTPATDDLPEVAVIVAAFNEETHIGARIANLLAQDYPADKLTILVGSDGSTDRTVSIAGAVTDPRVKLLSFSQNRGKASVLNDCVQQAAADILVFTDANTVFQPDTVKVLVSRLGTGIGAVCGELILEAPKSGENADYQYWGVERRLKAAESHIGGLLGANGGVYAIRKALYQPIAPDCICDDFTIAMNIAVAGHRVVYEPSAIAFEDTPSDTLSEYHRRVRIGIGNYQALFRHPNYLFGGSAALSLTYFSHKVLRWLTPHLLMFALVCSALLSAQPLFLALVLLQLAGYAFALFVFITRNRLPWPKIVLAGMFFLVLHAAFLVGFKRFIFADYRGSWRRTER